MNILISFKWCSCSKWKDCVIFPIDSTCWNAHRSTVSLKLTTGMNGLQNSLNFFTFSWGAQSFQIFYSNIVIVFQTKQRVEIFWQNVVWLCKSTKYIRKMVLHFFINLYSFKHIISFVHFFMSDIKIWSASFFLKNSKFC